MTTMQDERRAPPPPTRRGRRRLAAGIGVAALLGAGFWAVLAFTVPSGSYDDAIAARDAALDTVAETEGRLAAAERQAARATADAEAASDEAERLTSALATSQAEAAAAGAAVEEAEAEASSMRERTAEAEARLRDAGEAVEAILAPASALAMWDANRPSEMLDDLEAAGADITVADDMLAALGVADTTREFVTDDLFVLAYLTALAEAGPEAEAAWDAYLRTPSGSDEEWAAHQELYWQLEALTIERIQDAMRMLGALVGSPGV